MRCDMQRTGRLIGVWKRAAAARAAAVARTFCGWGAPGTFGILMYHRVTDAVPDAPFPTWNVTPRRFRSQLRGLLARGYRPRHLREVLAACAAGRPIPPRTFVVTFDDGYENNYTDAYPILRETGVPATIFLATAYLDSRTPFPCDDWEAAGTGKVPVTSWRPLATWQCKEMHNGGLIDLGTHTHTHGDFRGRPELLYRELRFSLDVMRKKFGLDDATFAFPYGTTWLGYAGPPLSDAARDAGVLCALSTDTDAIYPGDDPFEWGRFTVEQSDTGATLAAKLDGWYGTARHAWRAINPLRLVAPRRRTKENAAREMAVAMDT